MHATEEELAVRLTPGWSIAGVSRLTTRAAQLSAATAYTFFGDTPATSFGFPNGFTYELGVDFSPQVDGQVTRVRFYAGGASGAGVHEVPRAQLFWLP